MKASISVFIANGINQKTKNIVRFEVFMAVTMKNGVIWDVTLCGSCKNRRFRGTYHVHHQSDKTQPARNNINSNHVVSSSPILVTLMMEAIHSSESLVLTRATQRNIPDDTILLFNKEHCFLVFGTMFAGISLLGVQKKLLPLSSGLERKPSNQARKYLLV
jgi:hypothetical protein